MKFRDFNLRVSYNSRVLNFAILKKSRKSRNLELVKLSENKVGATYFQLLRPKLGLAFFQQLNIGLGDNNALLDHSRIPCLPELHPSDSAVFMKGKRGND